MSRIGIIGTTCVGKTTMVNAIAEKTGLACIKEDARSLYEKASKQPNFNREDPDWQFNFQHLIYTTKIVNELNNFDGFIADRTYLDNYMYFLYYCHKLIDKEQCLFCEDLYKQAMNIYTHLFMLELGSIPYKQDKIRKETYAGVLFYEVSIMGLIGKWGLRSKIIPISTSSLEDRVNFVIEKVSDLKHTFHNKELRKPRIVEDILG